MSRKDASVKVRLTVPEQEHAQRIADAAGISVSEMIRRLIATARIVVKPIAVLESEPIVVEEQHA